MRKIILFMIMGCLSQSCSVAEDDNFFGKITIKRGEDIIATHTVESAEVTTMFVNKCSCEASLKNGVIYSNSPFYVKTNLGDASFYMGFRGALANEAPVFNRMVQYTLGDKDYVAREIGAFQVIDQYGKPELGVSEVSCLGVNGAVRIDIDAELWRADNTILGPFDETDNLSVTGWLRSELKPYLSSDGTCSE